MFKKNPKNKSLRKELKDNIQILERAPNWEEAIRIASEPLLEKQKIEERYIEEMINNIKRLGPYVVLMPRVAMPHSRQKHGVIENCISLLKLDNGVSFSAEKEDVNLIFILGAKDGDSHSELIAQLTEILLDEERIKNLIRANSIKEILFSI